MGDRVVGAEHGQNHHDAHTLLARRHFGNTSWLLSFWDSQKIYSSSPMLKADFWRDLSLKQLNLKLKIATNARKLGNLAEIRV